MCCADFLLYLFFLFFCLGIAELTGQFGDLKSSDGSNVYLIRTGMGFVGWSHTYIHIQYRASCDSFLEGCGYREKSV